MIITEDNKDKKLPPQPQNNPYVPAASAPEGAPPPYEPSAAGTSASFTSTTFSTGASASTERARDATDLLSGNPEDYSAGPSVLPIVDPIPPWLPKQNKLRVDKQNEGIKDTFVIDANLPAPPGSPDKALDLYSSNGSVNAKVYLIGVDVKRKTELAAKSKNGSVKFHIVSLWC
ncbi:hypothetical protein CALVIDRAFT_538593 [Calocera viscosa TUFC12733]|uniref:DUF7330 domain-containing protein n=1 Tax=Calocera viscosa (strain TUFC12733) TaxID=1330018 RepID=A0A167KMP3_CALVF|nr:hypothetical protein CALVIDRAFT_538593 [Calocera viscosa TUFC12733]